MANKKIKQINLNGTAYDLGLFSEFILFNNIGADDGEKNLESGYSFESYKEFKLETSSANDSSFDASVTKTLIELKALLNFKINSAYQLQFSYTDVNSITLSTDSTGTNTPSDAKLTIKAYADKYTNSPAFIYDVASKKLEIT